MTRRPLLAAAGMLAGAVCLGACGSPAATPPNHSNTAATTGSSTSTSLPATTSSSSSTTSSSSTSSSTSLVGTGSSLPTNGGKEACTTASLRPKLGQSQGAAGSLYMPLVLTNTGTVPCILYGYPGVSAVKGTGTAATPVGAPAGRNPTSTPAVVTLPAGGSASALVQIAEAGNYPSATCQPQHVTGLRVFPPGTTNSLAIAVPDLVACSSSAVTQLHVGPVVSGTTGTTPSPASS